MNQPFKIYVLAFGLMLEDVRPLDLIFMKQQFARIAKALKVQLFYCTGGTGTPLTGYYEEEGEGQNVQQAFARMGLQAPNVAPKEEVTRVMVKAICKSERTSNTFMTRCITLAESRSVVKKVNFNLAEQAAQRQQTSPQKDLPWFKIN
jgi:hypothetical protein